MPSLLKHIREATAARLVFTRPNRKGLNHFRPDLVERLSTVDPIVVPRVDVHNPLLDMQRFECPFKQLPKGIVALTQP